MSEKAKTNNLFKSGERPICDNKISTTSLVYLRCAKQFDKYLKTRKSGVKNFIVAKNVAGVGDFGDIVIRLEYFDEAGKLKTKLIFVAFTKIHRAGKENFEESIQFFFDSFIKIKKILQPKTFTSAASHSKTQQSETASEIGNLFNCKISDCEFVLCNRSIDKKNIPETDERFNITNEILGTESADWLSFKYEKAAKQRKYDPKYNSFKILFCENFRILDNSLENDNKIIIQEMQSLFQSPDSRFEKLCENLKTEIKYHFNNSTSETLSEKSDLLQKFMELYGLKSRFEETIDPTCSSDNTIRTTSLHYTDTHMLHDAEETELHRAAGQNHVERIKELIDRDPTLLNSLDRDGKTPLHIACEMDNTEAAECLLNYPECLVNIADKYEKYALHYAAENGNVDIIKLLRKREAEVLSEIINKKDVNGETALYLACKYGRTEAVELLLSYPRCLVDIGGEKLYLQCAAENGYVDIIKLLLKHDPALLNKQDKYGETALHLACAVGNLEVVNFLLTPKYLELNVKDKRGNTCIHTAVLSNSCNILIALLKKEPDFLKMTNDKGRTALHVAASIRNDAVIEFLLDSNECDVNVKDINGDTPLHLYVNGYKQKHFDIENTDVNIFKQKCSSLVNIANKDGDTPLHKAVQVADHESVKKLIEMRAKIFVNNSGQTPVDLAQKLVRLFEKDLIVSYLKDATIGET